MRKLFGLTRILPSLGRDSALLRSFLYYHSVDPSANSAAAVKEAADRAMSLAPELGEAWLAQGTYRSRVLNDPAKAVEAYREAQKRLPNSALVNEYMAYAERRLGDWREAEAHLTRATELDPRNARLWTSAASEYSWPLGRGAEAEAALDRALEISPNDEFIIALKTEQYQQEGRLNEAAKELARIPKDSTDKTVLYIAWIRRCSNVTSTKQSSGLARQQALPVQDKRSTPRTSLLSCFRDIVSCGPGEMKKRAPRSSVLSRKLRLGEFSALRRFSERGFTLPLRTRD